MARLVKWRRQEVSFVEELELAIVSFEEELGVLIKIMRKKKK